MPAVTQYPDLADITADFDEDWKLANPIQIIALNMLCSFGLGISARILGATWMDTLFVSWIGGAIATVLVLFAFLHLFQPGSERIRGWADAPIRPNGPTGPNLAMVAAMESDAAADRRAFLAASRNRRRPDRSIEEPGRRKAA